ncbi:MAG TPA: DUF4450 domain-containing protein [Candidatus Acidoferrales bacterium]|nr:DUF4450 domain-containing protein [Candidatus Acidoferrales bacterium]
MVELLLILLPITVYAAAPAPEISNAKLHAILVGNVARPLRYWPLNGDFVITNGTEFFNRPLYCENSAFRIDCGDKPEFSIYAPGHGGNFRPGIKTVAGIKWLNDADEIVARYRAGSMIYGIRDSLLTGSGKLMLAVLPLAGAHGFIVRAEQTGCGTPVRLVWAFGGANGIRGKRGGDIGCESQPISEFFQLHPEECKGNEFLVQSNSFLLRSRVGTLMSIFPVDSALGIADATKWNSAGELLASVGSHVQLAVAAGGVTLPEGQGVYFALGETNAFASESLPELFSKAEKRREKVARQVIVETPDSFINAAVPALNVAANAIWDEGRGAFMHGAVAWRERLAGWRGPYAGDALGWHERTAEHFAGFARQQNIGPIPDQIPPADESANLARNEAALHSNGDLTKSHYDMNLIAVDAFFRHLLWTGDINYARTLWPVIQRHLAWERRLFRREFGPDHLPLYEGYAAIWASDDLSYNGGGAAHASAYNYFENMMAARVAHILGEDPVPYEREAKLILLGMNKYLWLSDEGCFAEYKDYLGFQMTHSDPALWTFYTTIDEETQTPSQAWQMSRWVDSHLARVPVCGANVPEEGLFTLPTSNWMPYEWSLNNVVMAEAAHASLAYWEAGRPETAYRLFKGELLLSMCCGLCPGNLGAMTSMDAARGEAQRDFGDAIGINARTLVEGLFGVSPDALAGTLRIAPGFPSSWNFASVVHPDFSFEFRRTNDTETFLIVPKFKRPMRLIFDVLADPPSPKLRRAGREVRPTRLEEGRVASVTINGIAHSWKMVRGEFGPRRIEIDEAPELEWDVRVTWKGDLAVADVTDGAPAPKKTAIAAFDWNAQYGADEIFETIKLAPFFNDKVGQIFKNEYRSPRSPFCSLAIPMQGIGGWCEPNTRFDVDDSGLRSIAAENDGKIILPDGVPFETPASTDANNIIFTSQWRNYPEEVSIPLAGRSGRAFLLMAGSTDPMQSGIENGEVVVTYRDGTNEKLPLQNPTNWWPIDQDYFIDDFAFRLDGPLPPRVDLKTGRVRILNTVAFKGRGGTVPGGAATVLELPLNPKKELKSLSVRAMANEVVVGLMAVTLERE